jgi:hypothetical protein
MLSDEEKREFELHMMECEHCFRKAKEFDPYIEMISRDPAVRDSIEKMSDESTAEGYGKQETLIRLRRGRGRRRNIVLDFQALENRDQAHPGGLRSRKTAGGGILQ